MDFAATARKLGSLGHEQRLRLFHRLLRAGRNGLTIGQVQEALDRPMSTVTFHLRQLVAAGMVVQQKEGRFVRCRASFEALDEIAEFIARECCKDVRVPPGTAQKSR
jgi:ArsR family transcriptional regulator, arsenate/arsenite/antimonite-responsive transcriptional repressor